MNLNWRTTAEAFLRGREFEKQGKPVDAVVAFREALQDDSQMAAAGVHLGAMLQITGQIQD
jgi:hypothetical protein